MQVDPNDRLHYLTETARFQTVAEEVKVYKGAINHIKWHLQVKYKKTMESFQTFFWLSILITTNCRNRENLPPQVQMVQLGYERLRIEGL